MTDLWRVLNPSDRVVLLAGSIYREFLIDRLRATCCAVEIPLEGLPIGKQKQWLKNRTQSCE